uniref:Uncharacterized protein n=1 Tax=Anguilla anguilla TaxID=7936 RepID=A0A0E9W9F1_ANGAN
MHAATVQCIAGKLYNRAITIHWEGGVSGGHGIPTSLDTNPVHALHRTNILVYFVYWSVDRVSRRPVFPGTAP